MCLIQIKHAQIKFPLSGFWTVYARKAVQLTPVCAEGRLAYAKYVQKDVTLMLSMHGNTVSCIFLDNDQIKFCFLQNFNIETIEFKNSNEFKIRAKKILTLVYPGAKTNYSLLIRA